ncbi:MAG: type II toxin-antitoxin system RelE/ParE family toxin [Nanoarchaeota archaeon]
MYEIFFTESAKQQLRFLPDNAKLEIGSALERIKVRPFKFVRRMRKERYYRLRTSNHRILMDIGETSLIILVVHIGQRRNVYSKKIGK